MSDSKQNNSFSITIKGIWNIFPINTNKNKNLQIAVIITPARNNNWLLSMWLNYISYHLFNVSTLSTNQKGHFTKI